MSDIEATFVLIFCRLSSSMEISLDSPYNDFIAVTPADALSSFFVAFGVSKTFFVIFWSLRLLIITSCCHFTNIENSGCHITSSERLCEKNCRHISLPELKFKSPMSHCLDECFWFFFSFYYKPMLTSSRSSRPVSSPTSVTFWNSKASIALMTISVSASEEAYFTLEPAFVLVFFVC